MNNEKLNELKKLLRILLDSKIKLNALLENYYDADCTEWVHITNAKDNIITAGDNIATVMIAEHKNIKT
jgi:hypothetical protein